MCVRGLVFHRRGDARRKQSEPNDFTTTTRRGEPNRREDAWQHRLCLQPAAARTLYGNTGGGGGSKRFYQALT